ncbi:MAG: LLM class F420-dependent oxidoreductase [Sphingomonadaceae bacterium]|nr:LLM class F420-dependent oxidoreductase [Sphingomonadaceae bacterium]
MEIGIIFPQTDLSGDTDAVRRFGLAAEEHGFQHLLVYDHVLGATHDREPKLGGPYTDKDTFHDPFAMLSYIAAITQRIELVTGVLILPQRQTALVARQAADVDLLSGERFRLGIGTGWNYVEYDALGQDFGTRGKRQAEQIELLRRLWTEPQVDFSGEFDRMDRVTLNPRPKRSIPIWMGGFSNVALRRAARMADGFIFAERLGKAGRLVEKMGEFLDQAGRKPEDFGMQLNLAPGCPVGDIVERAQHWRDCGGSHLSVTTLEQGFSKVDEHLSYMDRAAEELSKAGLL